MKGYIWIGKGARGRLKLAAIRSSINEALELAAAYEKIALAKLKVPQARMHVCDENGMRYQSVTLKKGD